MHASAFEAPGRFWRGNIHTHSDRSDGTQPPDEVCRRYRERGYDFIALTDHLVGLYQYPIVDTAPFRTDGFTTLLGAEMHSGAMENGEIWHLLAVGLPADFTPPAAHGFTPTEAQETGPELARRADEAGAFVAIVHPHWSGLTETDARSIDVAHAVEIYNHGAMVACDRGEGLVLADRMLTDGRRVGLIATDDAHFRGADAFGGWVMVKAEENTPGALLAALRQGHYYSSEGPDLHRVALVGDAVEVDCSPCETVILQGSRSAARPQHGHAMTEARIPLDRFEGSPWLRVTVRDADGKRAWSNPIWR